MRLEKLDPPIDLDHDHILGPPDAELTLVEYGSYAFPHCHAVHEAVEGLRNRFAERMRYVFRHLPVAESDDALRAAELAEYAAETTGRFWEVHEALMERGPAFSAGDFGQIAREFNLPPTAAHEDALAAAQQRVRADAESGRRSGARVTPTFFINGRRYAGPWDESSLADAMLEPLGHRIQSAAFQFVRWGPSSGLLLGLTTTLALVLSNSSVGPAFQSWRNTRLGLQWGGSKFDLTLLDWVNHGLLTIFFFVVGLEIKREFTVGHLASFRSGALPVIAALGGIILPAIIFASIAPPPLRHGWGIPIGTDTAFAVALIVLLGERVPIELRVFLTAAVIIDDIVAIVVIALFYSGEMNLVYLIAGVVVVALLQAERVDYTRFFRCLGRVTGEPSPVRGLEPAVDGNSGVPDAGRSATPGDLRALFADRAGIDAWLERYRARLVAEQSADGERAERMRRTNPKYVLRNWIAQEAIERAEAREFGLIEELRRLFADPYAEHPAMERYAGPPAAGAPEVAVSCSS